MPKDDSASGTQSGSLDDHITALPVIPPVATDAIPYAGFNGRFNKVADTCYSFWNGATLMVCALVQSQKTVVPSHTPYVDAGPVFCD